MMRPLPAYTVRPLKRREIRRTTSPVTVLEMATRLSTSVRAGRQQVKPPIERERPGLRVLGRDTDAGERSC